MIRDEGCTPRRIRHVGKRGRVGAEASDAFIVLVPYGAWMEFLSFVLYILKACLSQIARRMCLHNQTYSDQVPGSRVTSNR